MKTLMAMLEELYEAAKFVGAISIIAVATGGFAVALSWLIIQGFKALVPM